MNTKALLTSCSLLVSCGSGLKAKDVASLTCMLARAGNDVQRQMAAEKGVDYDAFIDAACATADVIIDAMKVTNPNACEAVQDAGTE